MVSLVVLLFIFFVALFVVFFLSKNDLVLIKKQIDVGRIFNLFFTTSGISIVAGRIFYILDASRIDVFNPLQFIHFLKFPGFSFFGAYTGLVMALFLLVKEREAIKRIYDIFTISFLPLMFFGLLLRINIFIHVFVILLLAVFLSSIIWVMIKVHRNYLLKDGSLFFISFIIFSFVEFVLGIIVKQTKLFLHLSFTQLIAIIILFIFLVLLAKNESIFSYIRKGVKK